MLPILAMALLALLTFTTQIGAAPTSIEFSANFSAVNIYGSGNDTFNVVQGVQSLYGRSVPAFVCELPGTTCLEATAPATNITSTTVTRIFGFEVHHLCHFHGIMCNTIDLSDTSSLTKRGTRVYLPYKQCGFPGRHCAWDENPDLPIHTFRIPEVKKRAIIHPAPWSSCGPPGFICAADGTVVPGPATESKALALTNDIESTQVNHSASSNKTGTDKRALVHPAPWSSCGPPGFICALDGTIIEDTSAANKTTVSNTSVAVNESSIQERKVVQPAPWSSCGPPGFICAHVVDGDQLITTAIPMAPSTLAAYGLPAATAA